MNDGRVNMPRISWILVLTIAVVSLLAGVYVWLTPIADQTELRGRMWAQFAASDPEVAALYALDVTLLGMSLAAFGMLAVVVAAIPYRLGERWAWYALWTIPLLAGGVALRMFMDQYPAAPVYAVAAMVATLGLLIPIRQVIRT